MAVVRAFAPRDEWSGVEGWQEFLKSLEVAFPENAANRAEQIKTISDLYVRTTLAAPPSSRHSPATTRG